MTKKIQNQIGCIFSVLCLLFIPTLVIYSIFSENIYEKENRYETALDNAFVNSINNSSYYKSLDKSYIKEKNPFPLTGNICPVFIKSYNLSKIKITSIDHFFAKELLSHNQKVSYDLDNIDYFILHEIEYEKIGTYVDEQGKKTDDANVATDKIYIFNTKNKILTFAGSKRGDNPKQIIRRGTHSFDHSTGEHWSSEDMYQYLSSLNYFPNNIGKRFYTEEYVDFLENENFFKTIDL